jgi:hypothetical protein
MKRGKRTYPQLSGAHMGWHLHLRMPYKPSLDIQIHLCSFGLMYLVALKSEIPPLPGEEAKKRLYQDERDIHVNHHPPWLIKKPKGTELLGKDCNVISAFLWSSSLRLSDMKNP